ncbi:mitochondrial metalloendopeptidase OMA1-like [Dioscorea cayenensis subsp. rotundata]|uniref:Mitochondrial metalloendopeptidase OMA1-like n=1 Tax=Dioscorea cayennensis subsp. rotundata TaxID=55577 RepID=A0AB40AUI9_DIOCR|nr:mitochondrial metalloendopeptidase OMA1-like [Dioscorea cayenensis subsp. rotundata]
MTFLRRSLPLLRRSISSKIPSSPRPHLPLPPPPPLLSRSISNPNPTAGRIPNPFLSCRRFYNLDRLQLQEWYHNNHAILLDPLVVFLGVILGGGGIIYYRYFETVPISKFSRLVLLSPSTERELSEIEFQEFKKGIEGRILPANHPDSIRVRRISENIIEAIQPCLQHDNSFWVDLWYAFAILAAEKFKVTRKKAAEAENWEVFVVSDKTFYAFCLPCGKIVVSTGVLDHLRTDDEIAALLGHEVAHVITRHGAEVATKDLWLGVHEMCQYDMFTIRQLFDLYDRMRRETDDIGRLLMAYAGYDRRIAPRVYEKLREIRRFTLWDY